MKLLTQAAQVHEVAQNTRQLGSADCKSASDLSTIE